MVDHHFRMTRAVQEISTIRVVQRNAVYMGQIDSNCGVIAPKRDTRCDTIPRESMMDAVLDDLTERLCFSSPLSAPKSSGHPQNASAGRFRQRSAEIPNAPPGAKHLLGERGQKVGRSESSAGRYEHVLSSVAGKPKTPCIGLTQELWKVTSAAIVTKQMSLWT